MADVIESVFAAVPGITILSSRAVTDGYLLTFSSESDYDALLTCHALKVGTNLLSIEPLYPVRVRVRFTNLPFALVMSDANVRQWTREFGELIAYEVGCLNPRKGEERRSDDDDDHDRDDDDDDDEDDGESDSTFARRVVFAKNDSLGEYSSSSSSWAGLPTGIVVVVYKTIHSVSRTMRVLPGARARVQFLDDNTLWEKDGVVDRLPHELWKNVVTAD